MNSFNTVENLSSDKLVWTELNLNFKMYLNLQSKRLKYANSKNYFVEKYVLIVKECKII